LRASFAHSQETRSGTVCADGAAEPLDPVARVAERVARLDRDPDLDAALAGRLRVPADAEVLERRPVEPGDDECLVPGRRLARVDVDEANVGRSGASRRLVQAWTSKAAWLPSQHRWATSVATRCSFASRASTPVSRQRVSHAGAVFGMSFCQKLLPSAPSGKRFRLSARPARWGSMTGAILPK
jgi:hypothetical protein